MDTELSDRVAIRDVMGRYARAVDRGDFELLRSVFHADGYDDHGPYKGGVDGFIHWLKERFTDDAPMQHFLGNSLIEFADANLALVETYYVASRPPKGGEVKSGQEGFYVLSWGRYVDRFERRGAEWRVAYRRTVVDLRLQAAVNVLPGTDSANWGRRDEDDALHIARREIFGR
ncbi:nuclear transport factor 2 family protein [Variovorax defluvii]